MITTTTTMPFPNELWMHVFEELDSPNDLAAVVRTNKRFKSLGIRVLYRHIIWSDPLRFIKNHPFLQGNNGLRSVVRSLTLGISTATSQIDRIEQISRARAIINLSGEITSLHRPNRTHEARVLDEIGIASPVDFLASGNVTDTMYNHALTFTNLRDLTFNSMVLPDSFYEFVHRFPALNKLAIENCTPPLRPQFTDLHPRDLPITELTIVGLRGRRDPRELRAFAEGKQLRVIRFDWTCYIYKHFCEHPIPAAHNNWLPGFVVVLPPGVNNLPPLQTLQIPDVSPPPQLFPPSHNDPPVPSPHIHTIDVKFPTQKSWQSYVSEPHDNLINPFVEFLVKCPHITNLRIRNYLPWLRLPDTALPNLTSYQGPLTTIKSVVSGPRRLKHLSVRDPAGGLPALEKALKDIEAAGCGADLDTLSVFIGWWDDEILYAVLHHFNNLKRLEILYKEGDPTEEMVLGMGAHFFGLMPHLWSVRVFKVMPPGVDNVGSAADNLGARGYPHRSVRIALGEYIGVEGPERSELDDTEFEEAKLGTASSSSSSSSSRVGWTQEPEEDNLRELIHAWNRYCPVLREVQLKAGYVWRRAGPDDVWTQRPTKVNRVRNAGFEEA
ncbi:hypothetical protein JVT61DRAFT_9962 [Boletus reticuloceps]|uniref:F-box domain-containing protein n=1 Tax=Boletus reticuloceps TaxID=495285 RepID=A0A8I2YZL3_9AGAM|nr:hypothetical protein JVT61DRAFT_9962 [Boletus reticuloceps]